MWTRFFWIDTAERTIRTMAQTLLSLIGVNIAFYQIEWVNVLSVTVTAGILTILTALATQPTGDPNTASVLTPQAEDVGGVAGEGVYREG